MLVQSYLIKDIECTFDDIKREIIKEKEVEMCTIACINDFLDCFIK